MKSGRSSVSFLLGRLKPIHVYLPFYTCNALIEPFEEKNIPFSFYAVNKEFEIESLPVLKEGELLVYINYYGIKNEYAEYLSGWYKDRLVIDCTQAYFEKGNGRSWYFNSTRKFFGVPDGSDLYVPTGYDLDKAYHSLPVNQDYLTDHLIARFNGNARKGYPYFQQNELLNGDGPAKMSALTAHLLSRVDFEQVMEVRKANFNYLHHHLNDINQLPVSGCPAGVPFFYPYLPQHTIEKEKLWAANLFVPVLWPDCLQRKESVHYPLERELSEHLLPLPIDHRYSFLQMDIMLSHIQTNK